MPGQLEPRVLSPTPGAASGSDGRPAGSVPAPRSVSAGTGAGGGQSNGVDPDLPKRVVRLALAAYLATTTTPSIELPAEREELGRRSPR